MDTNNTKHGGQTMTNARIDDQISPEKARKISETLSFFKSAGIATDSSSDKFQRVLDFQDDVMRLNKAEMFSYYMGLYPPERRTFLWACSCALGQENVESIMDWTIIKAYKRK